VKKKARKSMESMKQAYARMDGQRKRLTDLLGEWPIERRLADQGAYIEAIKEHYRSCEDEN
jgi:hypothetical protein